MNPYRYKVASDADKEISNEEDFWNWLVVEIDKLRKEKERIEVGGLGYRSDGSEVDAQLTIRLAQLTDLRLRRIERQFGTIEEKLQQIVDKLNGRS
ncbi:MAG TPA: hypothetical protein VM577_09060 [Anaerovoracaceae bacterium]|nr:hypothetical protein [Anaerovoracaceae bacterium]